MIHAEAWQNLIFIYLSSLNDSYRTIISPPCSRFFYDVDRKIRNLYVQLDICSGKFYLQD